MNMIHLLMVALIATMMFSNPITAAFLLLTYIVGLLVRELTFGDEAEASIHQAVDAALSDEDHTWLP